MPKVAPKPQQGQATGDIEAEYFPAYRAVAKQSSPANRFLAIKAAAVPLSAKRKIKSAVQYSTDAAFGSRSCRMSCLQCQASCTEGWTRFQIWRHSFKKLEGMYGSGVLSFFVFLKSLFILNLVLTLIISLFIIVPQAVTSYTSAQLITDLKAATATAQAGSCSEFYSSNISASVLAASTATKVLDSIQGTGFLENTLLFIGFYFPTSVGVGTISYSMPLAFLITTGVLFLASFLFMLNRTGAAFKEAVLQGAGAGKQKISALAFTAWDFALMERHNVQLAQQILRNNLIAELDLQLLLKRRREASTGRKCCTWLKRILVNLIVIALLGGAGCAIYFAQTASAANTAAGVLSSSSFMYFFYQFLPSIVISLLAGLLPIVFALLAKLEELKPDTELLLTLIRSVFLRLASVAVLIITIFNIVLCEDKDLCRINNGTCTAVMCWETYVGQAFYKLEIVFFVVAIVVCFAVEFPRSLLCRKCNCKLFKLIGPPEFDIADSVLQILYSQVIVWFGMFFCPFLPAMNVVVLFVFFYLRKFACYFSYEPAQRPFKSSRATTFFMVTLFVAYFLCVLPLGYLIASLPTSGTCSPFRTNILMYTTVTNLIATFSSGWQKVFKFLGSAGFLFFLLIVLLIIAYYFRTLASARREICDLREDKLAEEEEKKFVTSSRRQSVMPTQMQQQQQQQMRKVDESQW